MEGRQHTLKVNAQEHILIWNEAILKIIDVRHIGIQSGERAHPYIFPANAFLYITHGNATILLDENEHNIKGFHLLHGSKGAQMEITLHDESIRYYLIFYKATLPVPLPVSLTNKPHALSHIDHQQLHQQLPFHLHYGFIPLHPVILYELAEQMLNEWRTEGRLERLHVKTLFYHFVYEMLQQMDQQQVNMISVDLTTQLVRYMQEYYAEPLTLETIAHAFHYSAPYLSKHFRRETGFSIIDYLIGIRMHKSKILLEQTDLPLKEIALSVGYSDVSYFIRMFKKQTGITPKQFREQATKSSYRPIIRLGYSIAPSKLRRYIDNNYQYQHDEKGDLLMNRRKIPVGITILLCLTLLLSACSPSAGTNGRTGNDVAVSKTENSTKNAGNAVDKNTSTSSGTVAYSAINGEIEIPKNPQRIVMVAGAFTGHLLALGIKPVGTGEESFTNYTEGKLDDVVNIGNDVSYEKILSLQPDLIVVWNDAKTIEELSKIAPTVAVEYGVPMREQLLEFGKMTGREEQARAWIDKWDAEIAKYKPIVQQAVGDRTVSIFDSVSAKEFYAYGSFGRGGDIVYGEFNLKAPPIIQKEAIDSGKGWAKLSLELLPEYAGDYIIISGWTGEDNPAPVFEGKLWDNLPAVKNKRVYYENSRGFVFSDPISLEAQLKFVVDSLTNKK